MFTAPSLPSGKITVGPQNTKGQRQSWTASVGRDPDGNHQTTSVFATAGQGGVKMIYTESKAFACW